MTRPDRLDADPGIVAPEPWNGNHARAEVWYTPDCGHLHAAEDGTIHAHCPDGFTGYPDPLAPARGILRGCALGCLAWIGLALIVGRCAR